MDSIKEKKKVFQSTLPRRERQQRMGTGSDGDHFNPRSREGSDNGLPGVPTIDNDFNPRSREGSDTVSDDH